MKAFQILFFSPFLYFSHCENTTVLCPENDLDCNNDVEVINITESCSEMKNHKCYNICLELSRTAANVDEESIYDKLLVPCAVFLLIVVVLFVILLTVYCILKTREIERDERQPLLLNTETLHSSFVRNNSNPEIAKKKDESAASPFSQEHKNLAKLADLRKEQDTEDNKLKKFHQKGAIFLPREINTIAGVEDKGDLKLDNVVYKEEDNDCYEIGTYVDDLEENSQSKKSRSRKNQSQKYENKTPKDDKSIKTDD